MSKQPVCSGKSCGALPASLPASPPACLQMIMLYLQASLLALPILQSLATLVTTATAWLRALVRKRREDEGLLTSLWQLADTGGGRLHGFLRAWQPGSDAGGGATKRIADKVREAPPDAWRRLTHWSNAWGVMRSCVSAPLGCCMHAW